MKIKKTMKHLNIFILVLALGLLFNSCGEQFQCDNYEVREGSVNLNGEKMYPIEGTFLTNLAVFGARAASFTVRAVEDDCELNNTLIVSLSLEESDPITGTFDFAGGGDIGGQISYDQEENGTGGTTLSITSGSITITEGSDGVYSLDLDGETSDGETITMSVEYEF